MNAGVASVGTAAAMAGVEYRIDTKLGIALLSETRTLRQKTSDSKDTAEFRTEVSTTTIEVLTSHLSNYLGSSVQEDKVNASQEDFGGFIRQSIVGTDSIVLDTALHAQVTDKGIGGRHNIANLSGKRGRDPVFKAVGLRETLPSVTCNLEVAVFFKGGVHIAHRGQSRQYLVNPEGAKQLTRDYSVGGLLSSLDEKGDFLPSIELQKIDLGGEDRLVILSQGCLAGEHGFNLDAILLDGRDKPLGQYASSIAKKVAGHTAEGEYILVFEQEGEMPKVSSAKSKPTPANRTATYQDLEESKLFDPEELSEIKRRMKDRFADEFGAFEKEMYDILEKKISIMGRQMAEKLFSVPPGAGQTETPYMSMAPPSYVENAADMGWSLNQGLPENGDEKPYDIASEGQPKRGIAAALGRPGGPKQLRSWGILEKVKQIDARIAKLEVKGHRPFSNRWAMLATLGAVIFLIVFTLAALFGETSEPADANMAVKELENSQPDQGDVLDDEPAAPSESLTSKGGEEEIIEPKLEPEKPSDPVAEVDSAENDSQKAQEEKEEKEATPTYLRGEPKSRKEAYSLAKRLFRNGKLMRDQYGIRLSKAESINSLLGVFPYLEYARDRRNRTKVGLSDLLFLRSRTHYMLAHFKYARRKNAIQAIDSYNKYIKTGPTYSKRRSKIITNNMKYLRRWRRYRRD